MSDKSEDNSFPDNSISPSLLEVNYEQEGHDSSSCHSVVGSLRIRESQGSKASQVRLRSGSGKTIHAASDSDQDFDDKEIHPHSLRRRRRPQTFQQISPLSVKTLVDSLGVLQSDADQARKVNCGSDFFKPCKFCGNVNDCSHASCEADDPIAASQDKAAEDFTAGTCTNSEKFVVGLPQASLPVPVSPTRDTVDGMVLSAPIHSLKQYSASSKNRMKKKKTHGRSHSDGAQEVISKLEFTHSSTDPDLETTMSSSTRSIPVPKRFMEDGGHSITPAADNGFFPRPQPGQSLIGFLSSKEFHKQHAALDKENAHFNISEAVIAALTQMQFNAWHQKFSSSLGPAEESDEEIRHLQAQIQEKRRQKLSSGATSSMPFSPTPTLIVTDSSGWDCGSSPKPESTTDCSAMESPPSSCYNSDSDLISETEDFEQESEGLEDPLAELSSLSTQDESSFDLTSAEKVAISLLKNFNEQRLPKASELEWLVSEEEAPQKLLPLPTSIAVSPEDGCTTPVNTMPQPQLRGTSDWAPPRPQLILTLFTSTKRSVMMKAQGWRCAGCGMKVSEHLSRHFRLCNYLGRYFCTTCHSNQTSIIPARVIQKWDFKLYPVSNFSMELIESMKTDPLFNVSALNCGLYKKCRHLQQTRIYRLQLYYALPYINTCTRAKNEELLMENKPPHWASDPHAYSLEDLTAAKHGYFVGEVKQITKLCINHIAKCQVCAGQGFICEICGEGDPIFPFQLDSTALCATCSACYHVGCFCPLRCPRCIRRETRRSSEGALERC
ncbi:Run domain Beclin-1-interacting and cysteine-rich domain-containing protein [Chionoecetes opilio]|uniref:Run domain Beclin-1-interacting and cysteine-rich domain-containing protein n=1 Tax=Chionoecetes opilio TaxID=41210 RepID=A0A8J4Y0P5_CHIOP|nr:Run domain Beclin-1-interacting and cysteine-rich domain-containing protein [Chionoecetes opilio]